MTLLSKICGKNGTMLPGRVLEGDAIIRRCAKYANTRQIARNNSGSNFHRALFIRTKISLNAKRASADITRG